MSSSYVSPPNTPPPSRVGMNSVPARQNEYFSTKASNFAPLTPPTTPSKHATPLPSATAPTALSKNGDVEVVETIRASTPLTPEILKTRLGLNLGKCGAPTKYDGSPPCRNRNPQDIETQIRSMITLTQASRELPDQLKKLAELALCQWHILPKWKAPRIKCWKKAFPVGDEKDVPVEPIEDQIEEALDCFPHTSYYTCVGTKLGDKSCGSRIAGKRVLKGKRAVALIIKPENHSHDENLKFLLQVLAWNMFCYNHTDQIPEWVGKRKSRITSIYKTYLLQSRPIASTGPTTLPCSFKGSPSEFGDDADDTSAFVTEVEENRPSSRKACYSLIRNKMTEPLKKEELNDGYVYIYEVEGNEGFLKIGFTTRRIEDRSAEWKFQCDRTPKVLYPTGPMQKIPHANRVEGLCLAELKYRNMTVICEACPKRHIEWVQAPIANVIAVVQKWTAWIRTAPFEDSKRQVTKWEASNRITSWILRDEEERRTSDMLILMEEVAAASLAKEKNQAESQLSPRASRQQELRPYRCCEMERVPAGRTLGASGGYYLRSKEAKN